MISNSFTLIIIIGVQLIKIIYLSIHLVPDTILSYSNHSYKKCISSWVFFNNFPFPAPCNSSQDSNPKYSHCPNSIIGFSSVKLIKATCLKKVIFILRGVLAGRFLSLPPIVQMRKFWQVKELAKFTQLENEGNNLAFLITMIN